ncbi:MAG: hypothetical protein R3Y33_08900 [Clostridia bacterium]
MVTAIKRLWKSVCSVSQLMAEENNDTGRMEQTEEILFEDVPCLLVYTSDAASEDSISKLNSEAELFVDANLQIPEGAKITVTQNGYKADYAFAGVPRVYSTHREIPVVLFRRWT